MIDKENVQPACPCQFSRDIEHAPLGMIVVDEVLLGRHGKACASTMSVMIHGTAGMSFELLNCELTMTMKIVRLDNGIIAC